MDRYYIKPLLGMIYNDNRFFMICLGLEGPKLYQCTRFSINELPMEKVPESFKEAIKYSIIDRELQFHTRAPSSGAGEPGASFYSQGGGMDGKKRDIVEYFKKVAHGVSGVIGKENAPLLLVGLEQHFGIYKKANGYSFFIEDQYISLNPDDMTREELHAKAVELMGPYLLANRNRAIEMYHNLAGTGKTTADAEFVLPFAFEGRVDTLFIAPEMEKWGTFDADSRKVSVHTQSEKNDQDLLDLAALYTHLNGGVIYEVTPEADVPSPAALLRY